ncbi:MAG: ATP-binding protein [Lachnospiraceae bacterium]|nr:ATP-binding protein [Lachnospiraceae bacterium]
MERDIMQQLLLWKEKDDRKPLLLTGVRQCGKTYVCKEFGKQHFTDYAYFNFEGNTSLASVFEYDFDVKRIIDELGNIIRGKEIVAGETLVIFDEIQECPQAITALKYFCENMPRLHIVCAGSLLGVSIKRDNFSFPVGKVDRLQMFPMSFSEFLRADGENAIYEGVQKYDITRELPTLYTGKLEKELKYYYIVGGMPEVVAKWVETHNFEKAEAIQENILLDYQSDFAKHAPKSDIPKLGWIWESIPKQLAKDNNKFVFSHVKEGKRSSELEDALEWLVDAGLVHKLELVLSPELPLSFCSDATFFKLYMSDVGLLRKKSGISYKTILEDSDLYRNFKGAFTENFVLTEVLKVGIHPYFWRSGNTAELDFLFEYEDKIVPVEAKTEIHTRAKSYTQFCKKYQPKLGFKFSMKNVGENEVENTKTYSVPLYLIWRVRDYLE